MGKNKGIGGIFLKEKIIEFYNLIEKSDEIYLAGHTNPDGDSKSSLVAFAYALEKLGKKPYILLREFGEIFSHLQGEKFLYKGDISVLSPEVLICLDCADKSRLGEYEEVFDRAERKVNIDHHISNTNYGDINIVEDLSSACEVIYNVLNYKNLIDTNVARAIYSGMVTDTNGFNHSSTKKSTHTVAGELVEYDFDYPSIHEKLLHCHSLVEAKVLAKAIDNIDNDGDIYYSCLTLEEIKNTGATFDDLGGVVSYIKNISGCSIAVFVTERGKNISKISLRSSGFNVNEIASYFGGGGHIQAAGASNNDSGENTLKKVLELIKTKRSEANEKSS